MRNLKGKAQCWKDMHVGVWYRGVDLWNSLLTPNEAVKFLRTLHKLGYVEKKRVKVRTPYRYQNYAFFRKVIDASFADVLADIERKRQTARRGCCRSRKT
jgi:uncharacterized protein YvpB